jgi:hypothetical protein
MWGHVLVWGLLGAAGVAVTVAAGWVLYNWDGLVHDVLAPWARQHRYGGVLNFLVQVDDWACGLRRVVVRFRGRRGEKPLSSPVLVTEQVMRKEDLPPELRWRATHDWSCNLGGMEHGLPR